MNENQRKWLLGLQSKGVRFEYCDINDEWLNDGKCTFSASQKKYRIPAQPIPDIPDWRELCREMQDKGIEFEAICGDGSWKKSRPYFFQDYMLKTDYRIPNQPLPEWREEMNEEIKTDPREEIPHRELQIQWYEDWLHHLRAGEPMREYEFRPVNEDGDAASEWKLLSNRHPSWAKTHEYRRKPRTVKYWHCAVMFDGLKSEVITGCCKDEVSDQNKRCKEAYPDAKFSQITETTVEIED